MNAVNKESMDMTKLRSIFILTMPIFLELFLQMLVGNVDQFMIGRYSQSGVAAIGNSNQILNMIIIAFNVISVATTVLISLYRGMGDSHKAKLIYNLSIASSFIIGLVISFFVVNYAEEIFILTKVPADVMEEAVTYLTIIGCSIVFQGLMSGYTAIFRSNALINEPMFVSVVVNIINIGGNAFLIPRMGISGAAISSGLSRVIGFIVMMYIFNKKIDGKFSLSYFSPFPKKQLITMMLIGLPAGVESLSYLGSQLVIQSFVNPYGTNVIAAKTYATAFALIAYLFSNAIAQGSQIAIGYLLGKNDIEGIELQTKRTLIISISASLAFSIIIYNLCEPVLNVMNVNGEIIKLCKTVLFIDIFLEIGRALNMTLVRNLQTVQDVFFLLSVGITCIWIISVGGGYFLENILGLGLVGYWIAMAADEIIRGLIFLFRWNSGSWKTKKIIS